MDTKFYIDKILNMDCGYTEREAKGIIKLALIDQYSNKSYDSLDEIIQNNILPRYHYCTLCKQDLLCEYLHRHKNIKLSK